MNKSASPADIGKAGVRAKTDGARVSDRVADRILASIASGEWGPGQRLPGERQLAESMGVSRVSVRAALQSLKTQGFIDAVQGGGTRVISSASTVGSPLTDLVRLNRENLEDLAQIRAILEVWAVKRATINATEADIQNLAEIMEATEADINRGKHKTENDIRFHLGIAKASGSGIYLHLMGVFRSILQEMLDYHRYELLVSPEDDQQILAQHRAVFEAIRGRDPEAAGRAMERHLNFVVERYAANRPRSDGS